jgi:hypothetical protein
MSDRRTVKVEASRRRTMSQSIAKEWGLKDACHMELGFGSGKEINMAACEQRTPATMY